MLQISCVVLACHPFPRVEVNFELVAVVCLQSRCREIHRVVPIHQEGVQVFEDALPTGHWVLLAIIEKVHPVDIAVAVAVYSAVPFCFDLFAVFEAALCNSHSLPGHSVVFQIKVPVVLAGSCEVPGHAAYRGPVLIVVSVNRDLSMACRVVGDHVGVREADLSRCGGVHRPIEVPVVRATQTIVGPDVCVEIDIGLCLEVEYIDRQGVVALFVHRVDESPDAFPASRGVVAVFEEPKVVLFPVPIHVL